jgi:hypothetical protein
MNRFVTHLGPEMRLKPQFQVVVPGVVATVSRASAATIDAVSVVAGRVVVLVDAIRWW